MSSIDKTATLSTADDWDTWSQQFRGKAIAADIWEAIKGTETFLRKPTAPDINNYPRTAPSPATHGIPATQATPATQTIQATATSGTVDGITASTENILTPDGSTDGILDDLSPESYRSLNYQMTMYQLKLKDYKEQKEHVRLLKEWVMKTVSTHYFATACEADKSISEWYNNLKEQTGISNQKALRDAQDAYRVAVKPLTRMPKDPTKWSEAWEQAMAHAIRKKVPEALSVTTWFNDFIYAVEQVVPTWAISYKLHKEAEQLTLTYREVANAFREAVRPGSGSWRNPISHRIVKGSFGPSFAGAEDTKEAYPGDAQDSEDGSGGDGGERNNGKRRRDGSGGGRPKKKLKKASGAAIYSRICPCCGQFHHLAKCYYAFL